MSAPKPKILQILICGTPAGTLQQHDSGELSFSYLGDYRGAPLSLGMPVSNAVYGDKVVRPYLFGLLPDNPALRRSIGRDLGVSGNNPFDLLDKKGLDCHGAVQICPIGQLDSALNRGQSYRELTEEEIGSRLRRLIEYQTASWQTPQEHWSLGGQQSKIALARFNGTWHECDGAAATTHILKPGIPNLRCQALNEHFCLELAHACGIPAAKSSYISFDGIDAIAVERFDRIILEPFQVIRLHQEDFCQALGVLPENKYASDGGPAARDILSILAKHPNAQANKETFAAELFFNYLVGAPDAHGKNYSVLLTADGSPLLSPLYDVASGLPYDLDGGKWRAAMSIGSENRFGHVRKGNIIRFAEDGGLDPGIMVDLMGNIADAILREMPGVADRIAGSPGGEELAERLASRIAELCERTLALL